MGTYIVLGILIIIIILAISPTIKHVRGQGSCCGGGGDIVKETKQLDAPKIGEIEVMIEGMHCDNCKNSIERRINKYEGVVCKVNLRKNRAVIEYSRPVDQEEIKRAIESLDFRVSDIITK
ncbi:MAG: heavy-metal-associated domain-containing protein [Lachnospiraceae bacterium]|nr:heavy-metal-associated domain-containing protein [Lachnospiraceae bacterium]MBP3458564.1 heavy-metal-associated domain-containing protein [Lachnospiraceae bacterium]